MVWNTQRKWGETKHSLAYFCCQNRTPFCALKWYLDSWESVGFDLTTLILLFSLPLPWQTREWLQTDFFLTKRLEDPVMFTIACVYAALMVCWALFCMLYMFASSCLILMMTVWSMYCYDLQFTAKRRQGCHWSRVTHLVRWQIQGVKLGLAGLSCSIRRVFCLLIHKCTYMCCFDRFISAVKITELHNTTRSLAWAYGIPKGLKLACWSLFYTIYLLPSPSCPHPHACAPPTDVSYLGSRQFSPPVLRLFFLYELGTQPEVRCGERREIRRGPVFVHEKLLFCLICILWKPSGWTPEACLQHHWIATSNSL